MKRSLWIITLIVLLAFPTLLVFIEVVATDGAITEVRREELLNMAKDAGFLEADVAFVTAFLGRTEPGFRKAIASVAWNSFVWLASEPSAIIAMIGATQPPVKLNALLAM